jgi:hypothetical protein
MLFVVEITGNGVRALDSELERNGALVLDALSERGGGRHLKIVRAARKSAVRNALAASRVAAELWQAAELPGAKPDAGTLPRVVVERRFEEPLSKAEIRARGQRGGWCLEVHGVSFVKSYLGAEGRRMLCIYRAADLESVRVAQRSVGLPVARVWGEHVPRHRVGTP